MSKQNHGRRSVGFCRRDGQPIEVVEPNWLERVVWHHKTEVLNLDGTPHRDGGLSTIEADIMSVS